jgi:hypothetical protein
MNSETCLSCEGIERYLGEEEERVHALGVSRSISSPVASTRLSVRLDAAKVRCSTFLDCLICPMLAAFQSNRSQCPS